ncbi:hypothetical protein HYPSUDRAFT_204366 [Hypholoma sublateritium FD-334 SS-4]|uniref:Anaphase-promoting complex subunit 4 WD40 domain-containing protein n=1 Tax=Hypholoma sublateritium (strain FD-334 SS-4) TaxID=945553 RepID=A0A0D2KZA0_HYPSF|nr:hypothetical protein HYPSUDRAFT_204366 [Hypholoma sublateritium FD-334 SS-4]
MPFYFSNIANFIFRRPRLIGKFTGHSESVITLAFSQTGRLLASGGIDGVKVLDLQAKRHIDIPLQPPHERGQVSCICWVTRQDDAFETLCYGNALGFFIFLQHSPAEDCFKVVFSGRLAMGSEVLSMAVCINSTSVCVVTGSRDKCIQVWEFDSATQKLATVFSRAHGVERDIVPKALAFDKGPEKDVLIFGFYDGGLYRCSGSDGRIISRRQLGAQIGNAAVDIERRICVVDNVATGFDIHKLDTGGFLRTLEVGKPTKTYAKGVVFANASNAVIAGSDHGRVYIFDRKSGHILKRIKHSRTGGAETISAYDNVDGSVLIASASIRDSFGECPIRVWKWTPSKKRQSAGSLIWSIWVMIEWAVRILTACAVVAYAYEKTGKPYRWDSSDENGETVKSAIISEQVLREYIREVITKESTGWYLGPTADQVEEVFLGCLERKKIKVAKKGRRHPEKHDDLLKQFSQADKKEKKGDYLLKQLARSEKRTKQSASPLGSLMEFALQRASRFC